MKLKADRATLIKALAHIQSVAEKRNTIPILANVLIEVADGKLSLTATDMEIAVVEAVPASTSRDGRTTAPAATLYEIVRKLPDGAEVELDFAGGDAHLALRAGRFATSLVTLPTDDFPSMTAGQLPHKIPPHRAGAARPDRPHAVRHQHGGDAVLPQRASTSMPQTARMAACSAPSPRMATAWPGWRSRCPKAPGRCPA